MDEHLAVLCGGSRDGESTTVASGVDRLLATSDAPGLIENYERTGRSRAVAGNPEPAVEFEFVGRQPFGDLAPEMVHLPARPTGD